MGRSAALLVCVVLMMAGRAYSAQPSVVAAPVLSQEERLQRVERQLRSLTGVMLRLESLQREIRQLRGELELQGHAVESLKQRQRNLYLDIESRLGRLTPPVGVEAAAEPAAGKASSLPPPVSGSTTGAPPEVSTVAAAAVVDPVAEEKAYQKAFDLLQEGRYQESIAAFRALLERYPAGSFADNAQYWLGEASYVTRDFATALKDFEQVINKHPYSAKVPGAMLKIGYIHYEQQQWDKARRILTELRRKYPGSTESRLAEQRLQRMRAQGH